MRCEIENVRARVRGQAILLSMALLLSLAACKKSSDNAGLSMPKNPQQAASQLQQVFANANSEVKADASAASDALQTANYQKAVETLHTMQKRQNLSLEQGMAVHNSMVALETRLISAAN